MALVRLGHAFPVCVTLLLVTPCACQFLSPRSNTTSVNGLPDNQSMSDVSISARSLGVRDDCESLKDVVIANHAAGLILSPLCSMWPFGDFPVKSVSQANKILDPIFEKDGVWDLVKTLSKKRNSSYDPKFCSRHEQVRQTMTPKSKNECPSPISSKDKDRGQKNHDRLEDEDAEKLKLGKWTCKNSQPNMQEPDTCSCEKQPCTTKGSKQCVFPFYYLGEKYTSCTTEGDSWGRRWCATETDSSGNYIRGKYDFCDEETCDEATYEYHAGGCRTADGGYGKFKELTHAKEACKEACSEDPSCVAYEFASPDKCEIHSDVITRGAGGNSNYACYIKQDGAQVETRVEISAVPNDCDMTSNGACYKKCPFGYEPTTDIFGSFRTICQTKCTASNHHIPCGFGCANKVSSCVNAVTEQVGSVVRFVSRVIGLVAGVPNVADIFDALVSLVEFVVTTLPKLIEFFENAWNKLSSKLERGEKEVAIIFTLIELAKEASSSFVGKFLEMHETVKQIPRMFKLLVDAEWDWGLNLDMISSILEQFKGEEILLGFKMVNAFKRPKCEVVDMTPAFNITQIGDARFIGQWIEQGSHLAKPRYRLMDDRLDPYTPMIHWSRKNYWRAYVDNARHVGRVTLYTNSQNTGTPPSDGWEVDRGADPAPTLNLMAL